MTNFDLTAIVLAGGKSIRMGADKALLMIDGEPLIKRVCAIAADCAQTVVVITPWVDRYQALVPDGCQFIAEQTVVEWDAPHRTQGPLIGFAQALKHTTTEWVLLLACDLPRLRADLLQRAASHLHRLPPDAIAYLPRDVEVWQPLCGFYRRTALPSLEAYIKQGGRSFQGWLANQPVVEWPLSDRTLLFNCNTPADLQNLQG